MMRNEVALGMRSDNKAQKLWTSQYPYGGFCFGPDKPTVHIIQEQGKQVVRFEGSVLNGEIRKCLYPNFSFKDWTDFVYDDMGLNWLEQLGVDNGSLQERVIEFFRENPNPTDNEIHEFAGNLGINKHKFEEVIYKLLGDILGYGRSIGFEGEYDSHQLAMGIKVEMEHTNNKIISEKIAKDHLAEISDYYTRLDKMEKEAGVEHH